MAERSLLQFEAPSIREADKVLTSIEALGVELDRRFGVQPIKPGLFVTRGDLKEVTRGLLERIGVRVFSDARISAAQVRLVEGGTRAATRDQPGETSPNRRDPKT